MYQNRNLKTTVSHMHLVFANIYGLQICFGDMFSTFFLTYLITQSSVLWLEVALQGQAMINFLFFRRACGFTTC